MTNSQKDINAAALTKGEEKYIFLFKDDRRSEILRTLGEYAENPNLSFTWHDAAVLSQKIRKVSTAKTPPPHGPQNRLDNNLF